MLRVINYLLKPKDISTPIATEFLVTPASATSSAATGLGTSLAPGEGDIGKGEVVNAASWDEFPNGRFGDVNSPAFGNQDLWGGFSRIVRYPRPAILAVYLTPP